MSGVFYDQENPGGPSSDEIECSNISRITRSITLPQVHRGCSRSDPDGRLPARSVVPVRPEYGAGCSMHRPSIKGDIVNFVPTGLFGRRQDADPAGLPMLSMLGTSEFLAALRSDPYRWPLPARPAKSTCSARVRFHSVEMVGLLSPRSIWLTMDRDTPLRLATASRDRPLARRASFRRAGRRVRISFEFSVMTEFHARLTIRCQFRP